MLGKKQKYLMHDDGVFSQMSLPRFFPRKANLKSPGNENIVLLLLDSQLFIPLIL
jgi:hypothetical protein